MSSQWRVSSEFPGERRWLSKAEEDIIFLQELEHVARKNSLSRQCRHWHGTRGDAACFQGLIQAACEASRQSRSKPARRNPDSSDELDSLSLCSSAPSFLELAVSQVSSTRDPIEEKILQDRTKIKPNGAVEVLLYQRDLKDPNMKNPNSRRGSGGAADFSSQPGSKLEVLEVDSLIEEWVRRVEEDMPDVKIINYREGYLGNFCSHQRMPIRERCLHFMRWVSQCVRKVKREGIWGDQSFAKSAKAFHNDTAFKRFRRNVRQLFIEE